MKSHFARLTLFLLPLFVAGPLLASAPPSEHLGSVPVLLGLDSVRNELGLTKSQRAKLDALRAEFKSDVRLVTTRTPSSSVEKKAANSTVRALVSRYNGKAVAVLTPPQHARLVQIEHQTLGGLMLFLPGLQKQLGLSSGQVAELARIRAEGEAFASRITRSFENGDVSLDERLQTLRNYRLKESAKCLRQLSPEQRTKLKSVQGKPFQPA